MDTATSSLRTDFHKLQSQFVETYARVFANPLEPRTVVVVPSLTFDSAELEKIAGVHHYEERMLCLLMLLQLPKTRLVYLTSQPIAPTVIDYFLHLLPGIPSTHAKRRLVLLTCYDGSPRPLVQKILERPRLIRKIRESIPDPAVAHMSCFNATDWERELAVRLGIPLYAADPDLRHLGSKSGSRRLFREAGVRLPDGSEDLRSPADIVRAIDALKERNPRLSKAVVKLNEGFSGEGNAVFGLEQAPDHERREWIEAELPRRIQFEAASETWDRYCQKFQAMGGIVEAFVEGAQKRSPSVQCRINPQGQLQIVSTHDQILGGPGGQVFLGCTFPADNEYCLQLQAIGQQIGEALCRHGVIGRFAVDFVSVKQPAGWEHYAIEINLRKGGTTHPFMMLQFLTNGHFVPERGEFIVPSGESRCYLASDNVQDERYRGLSPDDLIDIAVENNLHFHGTIQQGIVFHLIGALSEFGKFGVVCVGDTPTRAKSYYDDTLAALERIH